MMYDSPPPSWYDEPEEDDHGCRGVWCHDRSHRDDEKED